MGSVVFNVIALGLIFFIVWWFWLGKKTKVVKADHQVVDIKVGDGVYIPDTIKTQLGETLTLRFTRHDETPCSEMVIFSDFDISAQLPVGKPVELKITPDKKGEFDFTCQMSMYRGKLIVE